ncbi:MAG: FoF1 ATP synthase subunit gamma [Clostridium fessum]
MAGLREIQNRIRGIQDPRKITNAMYLISSTKLKKARKELAETEPYFYALQNVIRRIQRHLPNMESPYFEKEGHQSKKTGLLVISGDKGLAGAYNHNIMKMADTFLKDLPQYICLSSVRQAAVLPQHRQKKISSGDAGSTFAGQGGLLE